MPSRKTLAFNGYIVMTRQRKGLTEIRIKIWLRKAVIRQLLQQMGRSKQYMTPADLLVSVKK